MCKIVIYYRTPGKFQLSIAIKTSFQLEHIFRFSSIFTFLIFNFRTLKIRNTRSFKPVIFKVKISRWNRQIFDQYLFIREIDLPRKFRLAIYCFIIIFF